MKIALPPYLRQDRPGTYLVGGSVRDLIGGKTPLDHDIAVACDPDGFARAIAARTGGRIVLLGKKSFVVYRVVSPLGCVDIAPFKGRNIRQDLLARDFTINALASDLADGRIIDVTEGLGDLRAGVVRMVAPSVFEKDPVRLIRAFRMAAMPGFHLEADTLRAVREHADLISGAAGERIWSELLQIMASPEACWHLAEMQATQILPHIFPELRNNGISIHIQLVKYDNIDHIFKPLRILEQLLQDPGTFLASESADFVRTMDTQTRALLKFSVLLHCIEVPASRTGDTGKQVHPCQPQDGGLVRAIGRRLRMSNRQREWIASLASRHQRALAVCLEKQMDTEGGAPEAAGTLFRQCGEMAPYVIIRALTFFLADPQATGADGREIVSLLKNSLTSYLGRNLHRGLPSVITGRDLIEHFGLEPSPMIGSLLGGVRELQLAGLITRKAQALEWIAAKLNASRNRTSGTVF